MATVHLAHDIKFDSKVALKLLNKEYVHNKNIRKRFLAEAKSMFRMSHSNIIKVTNLIDDGDTVAFIMEYIEGETLKDYIERKGKLSDEEIKFIFTQMLDAVGYVHKQNLVHRDIKPSNFMVDKEGKVKLLDFGIAKNTDSNSAEYTQTGTRMQMGTPMYMSPEQITETKSVTSQSDIYSLGVVLWQMVTGEKPYDTKMLSSFQLQMKIVQDVLPSTNTSWDSLITRATSINIENRFNTCGMMLESLNLLNSNSNSYITSEKSLVSSFDSTIIEEKINYIDTYPSVKIGNQVWMTKNLDVDRFRNGDVILEVKTQQEWEKAGENGQPACCFYDNEPMNGEKYGKLYNWYAVNDPRGLAPEGWHVPSDTEWDLLTFFLGGEKVAADHMKSKNGWNEYEGKNGNGTNESGLTALPGGYRNDFGNYNYIGNDGIWWSSSEKNGSDYAWYCYIISVNSFVFRLNNSKKFGLSVRCLRD